MHRKRAQMAAIALGLALAAASWEPARAEASPSPQREGPTFGAGLGFGTMFSDCAEGFDCDTVLESGSIHAFAGGFAGPSTALVLEGWAMVHPGDDVRITHLIGAGALQQWLTRRLWLKAGVGAARSSFSYDINDVLEVRDDSEIAPAALAAAGFEVVVGERSSFEIQLRYGAGIYDDAETRVHQLALAAGLSWR